jgi:hypothetical protein
MMDLVRRTRRSVPERARYREVLVITKTVGWRVTGHLKPYHLHVATEYGGTYGDHPWRDAQPQYPDQLRHGDGPPPRDGARQPEAQPPGSRPRRRSPASTAIAGVALALGLIGLIVSLFGVATQVLPRRFTAEQQREIINWEFGRNWRTLPAGAIFPASVSYAPPAVLDGSSPLTLTAGRIGIAQQATCRAATDPAAAAVLVSNGCSAVLRATYTDGTKSYVVTVGLAVLPSTAQAASAVRELGRAADVGGIAPGVRAVPVKDTPAAGFTNQRRQLSGSLWAGTYVALYTVGYADSRPREAVSGDSYTDNEMTSVGLGVARKVLSAVAPSVPTPHCPGTPGC